MQKFFTAIYYEIKLDVKEMLGYKVSLLTDLILYTAIYIAIILLDYSGGFMNFYHVDNTSGKMLIVIGYITWQVNSMAMGIVSGSIANDARAGILELRMQGKYPPVVLLAVQFVVSMLLECVALLAVIALTALTVPSSVGNLPSLFLALAISIPSILGSFGIGLILGGIALIEKSTGRLVLLLQTLLMFLSNAFSPTRAAACDVIPFVLSIDFARDIFLHNPIQFSYVLAYIVINALWLTAGCMAFNYCIRVVRKKYSFMTY
jgi:ABC-2 type transport system permease protein